MPGISAAEISKREEKLKETKEFVKGAILLGKVISAEMQDGFQSSDLINIARKLSTDTQFREAVWEAVRGIQHIPEEIKSEKAIDVALEIGTTALDTLKL